jgi:hypothetical protein
MTFIGNKRPIDCSMRQIKIAAFFSMLKTAHLTLRISYLNYLNAIMDVRIRQTKDQLALLEHARRWSEQ